MAKHDIIYIIRKRQNCSICTIIARKNANILSFWQFFLNFTHPKYTQRFCKK